MMFSFTKPAGRGRPSASARVASGARPEEELRIISDLSLNSKCRAWLPAALARGLSRSTSGCALILALLLGNPLSTASAQSGRAAEAEHPIKFSIFSSAWGENTQAGLRVLARNQAEYPVQLQSLLFRDENDPQETSELTLELIISGQSWAQYEMPYQDLLFGDDCIERTMNSGWKLVEISNYTLNPSVRSLIIQNSDSFRIYQCVRNVRTTWRNLQTGQTHRQQEWIMYHFERRATGLR